MATGNYSSGGSGSGYNTGNQGQPNFGTGSGSGHHSGTGSGSGHHSGTGSGSGHHSGTGSHLTGITGSGYGPSDGTQSAGRGSDGAFATGTGKGLNQGKANCLQWEAQVPLELLYINRLMASCFLFFSKLPAVEQKSVEGCGCGRVASKRQCWRFCYSNWQGRN